MSADEKTIRITCEGATMLPVSEFEEFQGELKWLEEAQYEKLKAGIVEDGFHTTIDVWKKNGEEKPRKMLDGHQRVRTVRKMIEDEGYTLPGEELPVDWVIADTEETANRMVLEKMSQYGRYDEDSVYKFIHDRGLDWPESLKPFVDFPAFNMGKFEVGWMDGSFVPEAPGEFPEVDETVEIKHECPKCGYKFS